MRYEIVGETLPAVICTLEEGETMITEKGAMSWMSPNMKMETSTNGGIGKAFGRMFSGEPNRNFPIPRIDRISPPRRFNDTFVQTAPFTETFSPSI